MNDNGERGREDQERESNVYSVQVCVNAWTRFLVSTYIYVYMYIVLVSEKGGKKRKDGIKEAKVQVR